MLFHTLTVNHHGKMDDPILNDFEYQSELWETNTVCQSDWFRNNTDLSSVYRLFNSVLKFWCEEFTTKAKDLSGYFFASTRHYYDSNNLRNIT
jgi:hypothetical protein